MKIDTEGTYTLRYTAEDECGNVTIEERTVEAVTLYTRLFTDGTLIINEKNSNYSADAAIHGASINSYPPLKADGATDAEKYIFSRAVDAPWSNYRTSIKRVEIGAEIHPESISYWFQNTKIASADFSLLKTDKLTQAVYAFATGTVRGVDFSAFAGAKFTNLSGMFNGTGLGDLSLDLSSFDTSEVTDMSSMFSNVRWLTSLDISSFDTSSVTDMHEMFYNAKTIQTIYASPSFVTDQVTNDTNMFITCNALVGGAGTAYAGAYVTNKSYARIDNPPSAPGYFTAKS